MKIGIIGAGDLGQTVARKSLALGHEVVICNRRGGDALAAIVAELGAGASAGPLSEVAQQEMVLFAPRWGAIEEILASVPDWNGRILLDATNAFEIYGPDLKLADLGDRSSSEIVAGLAPGARVVKAFNSIYMRRFREGPAVGDAKRIIFLSGDDDAAKKDVAALIEAMGFAAVDCGDLATGGRMHQAGGPLAGSDMLLRGQEWRVNRNLVDA